VPLLVGNCPRCGAKSVTFDVLEQAYTGTDYGWQPNFEIFAICRACNRPTIFGIAMTTDGHSRNGGPMSGEDLLQYDKSLNGLFRIEYSVSLRHESTVLPPDHLPEEIRKAFVEGATCLAVQCYNAAATMFRLCIDLATRPLLPEAGIDGVKQPNYKQRRDLGLRLQWLFDNSRLDPSLKELASCIREDGNDGAHTGNLIKEDAEDILDFTTRLLERLVTEPERLKQAEARRVGRRQKTNG
jgi:uncharacterized protein DUF4145